MLRVPSLPRPEVPIGKGEEDNVEIRRVGEPRKFDFAPKDHLELMTSLGMVEFEGPRRFAGQRSYALVGDGACSRWPYCGSRSTRSSNAA